MMGLVVLGSSVRRFHFFGRRQAMLVGDGGSPMADAHEEKALLLVFATHTASDYLPRLARAARRARGPRGETFIP